MIKKYGIPALVILVLVGIGLSNIIRVDGDTHTAAYKGSTLCKMCHQNTHKERGTAGQPLPPLGDGGAMHIPWVPDRCDKRPAR